VLVGRALIADRLREVVDRGGLVGIHVHLDGRGGVGIEVDEVGVVGDDRLCRAAPGEVVVLDLIVEGTVEAAGRLRRWRRHVAGASRADTRLGRDVHGNEHQAVAAPRIGSCHVHALHSRGAQLRLGEMGQAFVRKPFQAAPITPCGAAGGVGMALKWISASVHMQDVFAIGRQLHEIEMQRLEFRRAGCAAAVIVVISTPTGGQQPARGPCQTGTQYRSVELPSCDLHGLSSCCEGGSHPNRRPDGGKSRM
jgi:hypothetical protein